MDKNDNFLQKEDYLNAELRHPVNELLEIYLSIAICIKYVNDTLHQRVLLQLRQGHKLIDAESPAVIQV